MKFLVAKLCPQLRKSSPQVKIWFQNRRAKAKRSVEAETFYEKQQQQIQAPTSSLFANNNNNEQQRGFLNHQERFVTNCQDPSQANQMLMSNPMLGLLLASRGLAPYPLIR